MKKIIIFILVFVFAFSGCVATTPSDPQEDPNLVTVEVAKVSASGITLEIHNNAKDTFYFGEEYYVEKNEGGEWIKLEEPNGEPMFIAIAYAAEAGKSAIWEADFEWRYGALPAGEYRIIKDGFFSNEDGETYATHRMTAEFEVE